MADTVVATLSEKDMASNPHVEDKVENNLVDEMVEIPSDDDDTLGLIGSDSAKIDHEAEQNESDHNDDHCDHESCDHDHDDEKMPSREEFQKQMMTWLMQLPIEKVQEVLARQYKSWTKIRVLEQSSNNFIESVRTAVGEPPESLQGQLRVIIGVPVITNAKGTKKNQKKVEREFGERIIMIWNVDRKENVDPSVYNEWWGKAVAEQQKIIIMSEMQEHKARLQAKLAEEKKKKEEYDAMTPKQKLELKKKQMANQRQNRRR